jgi:hypothetical protein
MRAATEIGMTSIKGVKPAFSESSSTCRRSDDSASRPVRKRIVGLSKVDLARLGLENVLEVYQYTFFSGLPPVLLGNLAIVLF